MTNLKVRWRLHAEAWEPTARERGMNVYRELQRQGWNADKWDGKEKADLIILQYDMQLLEEALASARVVVADINDFTFAEMAPANYQAMRAGIGRVHAVVAGSPRLEEHLRRLHPRVRMIEQAVGPQYWTVQPQAHEGLNLFWMGMQDNIAYFEEIDEPLAGLAREVEFTVHFCTSRLDGRGQSNEQKVKAKPYPGAFHEWSIEGALAIMAECDLGLAPLFQNEWAGCKSAQKAANMMAAGLPVVVSDVPSYRAVIEDGVNGRLCFTPEDWTEALTGLLTDPAERNRMAGAGRLTAKEFTVEKIALQWADFFADLVA